MVPLDMSLSLFPHQITGVEYLKSSTSHRLLFDEQRVGKTPQMIVASGELGLDDLLIITPVAGVGVWKHQWKQWDRWGRTPAIVPWSQVVKGNYGKQLARRYDLLILDEGHYAKNPKAKRTMRVYGVPYGRTLNQAAALVSRAGRVWVATGTPMTHDPSDLFPMLQALYPQTLAAHGSFPDVSTYSAYRDRYCVVQMNRYHGHWVEVVVRGRNLDELRLRIKGLSLRRRQSEVGIRPAFWDTMPLALDAHEKALLEEHLEAANIKRNTFTGEFMLTEKTLAEVRRITGSFKAREVIRAAESYFDTYDDKLVIAYWHTAVGTLLEEGLPKFNPIRVDGSVTGDERTRRVAQFSDLRHRVFLAQIAACGEAIDLSAASELWFAESVFTPAQMAQMGARITNLNQPKQCLVHVAALEDSVDEIIQDRLVDLSRSIAHTLGENYNENFRAYRS
jgi:SWI/SNF-related matrix-associated actin-dependent regulator of chromatin subfamily A-like protein 1